MSATGSPLDGEGNRLAGADSVDHLSRTVTQLANTDLHVLRSSTTGVVASLTGLSVDHGPLRWLPGDRCDQGEVLVQVQDGEVRQFGGGRDKKGGPSRR